ncbi:MAG TPA: FkbM family methyltransferase, partial [Terriglobia bacterium]|nr:FkbM family methyltransferase [Terriglobia bacterium]
MKNSTDAADSTTRLAPAEPGKPERTPRSRPPRALRVRPGELIRRVARNVAPLFIYELAAELWSGLYGIRAMGWRPFFEFRALFDDRHAPGSAPVAVRIRGIRHPVFVRPGTTDPVTLLHSCMREAYGKYLPAGPAASVRLIVDAGANLGDTTVWYLNRFPAATVIAIEPDRDNFRILSLNCAPYGTRAVLKRAALWPDESARLTVGKSTMASAIEVSPGLPRSGPTGDAAASGLGDAARLDGPGVEAAAGAEGDDCPAVSLAGLMKEAGAAAIDIFKCDIEGAETPLFTENYEAWLPHTRHIAIEIHTEAARQAVFSATAKFGFRHVRY